MASAEASEGQVKPVSCCLYFQDVVLDLFPLRNILRLVKWLTLRRICIINCRLVLLLVL